MRINVYGFRGFPDIQGGVEKHSEELYPLIAKEGVHVKIFRRKPYVTPSNKRYHNVEFADLSCPRNKYLETVMHSFAAANISIKDRPDIVHIHNIGGAITLPLLKLFGIKTVVTYHSSNYEHSKWNRFAKSFLRFAEKVTFVFADRIIFVSNYKMSQFKLGNKAKYIPNGITDFSKLCPHLSLSKYNLKREEYILAVGRITPEKRFTDLIEAYSKFNTNMKLVIVGGYDNSSAYFNELMKYKKTLGDNLVLTGALGSNDLKLLYQDACIFVLPSENEGMPIVLLEAMNMGLYPLVSDIPENLDVIQQGKYGLKYKCKDIGDLEKNLAMMIKNKGYKASKGKDCRRYVGSQYTWKKTAEMTIGCYKEICKET